MEHPRQKRQSIGLPGQLFRRARRFVRFLEEHNRPAVSFCRAGRISRLLQRRADAHGRIAFVSSVTHLPADTGGGLEVLQRLCGAPSPRYSVPQALCWATRRFLTPRFVQF